MRLPRSQHREKTDASINRNVCEHERLILYVVLMFIPAAISSLRHFSCARRVFLAYEKQANDPGACIPYHVTVVDMGGCGDRSAFRPLPGPQSLVLHQTGPEQDHLGHLW